MSQESVIQNADLSQIEGALQGLQHHIGVISAQVGNVGQELGQTRSELSRLEQAFNDFVQADLKAKELSLAETRQVKIRQEIENRFGQNAVVRRHATGILQAADIQLVRQETLRGATEELMLSTPGYWLAPALVALAAWLADNRDLARRAVTEATRRDDEKTSLFFALIARRAQRAEASRIWLDRYFGLQNPFNLDRQTVVMVDAMVNGVFAADAIQMCSQSISSWIKELSQQTGFAETQRRHWSDALRSKLPNASHASRYSHLSRFSPSFSRLDASLKASDIQFAVLQHFQQIFDGEIESARSVQAGVDNLLTCLITQFDDEELILRRQEELCQFIIEENGDKQAAQSRQDRQSAVLTEQMDFMQLLTNAAMHPETSHVSRATQRFAIAHSRDWILDAHADVTAQARQDIPQLVTIEIEGWRGKSVNGENEQELLSQLNDHLDQREVQALAAAPRTGFGQGLVVATGLAMVFMAVFKTAWFLVPSGILLFFAMGNHHEKKARRNQISLNAQRLKEQSTQALRASLAELVELRRDLAERDAVANEVTALLESISPDQHLQSGHNTVRRVIATAA